MNTGEKIYVIIGFGITLIALALWLPHVDIREALIEPLSLALITTFSTAFLAGAALLKGTITPFLKYFGYIEMVIAGFITISILIGQLQSIEEAQAVFFLAVILGGINLISIPFSVIYFFWALIRRK